MNDIKNISKIFAFTLLFAIFFTAANSAVYAQKGKNKQSGLWEKINESNLQSLGKIREVTPEKYLVFRLNRTELKRSLADLPLENTNQAVEKTVIMQFPMPDGSVQKFRMEETAVLSPELAAQYTDWKSFKGYGIDDTSAVGRFDWNALGFHGYIETDKGIVFIDPYQKGDTQNYLVFYKHEFGEPLDSFSDRVVEKSMLELVKSENRTFAPEFSFGASIRTYRLAVATTGEWARNAAGAGATTPQQIRDGALAVIMTAVTRLNGIYERELASRFTLVNPPTNNNATNIIFDDPATDPYDNTSGSNTNNQLGINHTTITNRVGTANFDIGHLFGTGGGGVATAAALCSDQIKGEGYSARGTNTGDPFVVDYVSHELGHQFGGDHTYNILDTDASGGVCNTRAQMEAFEPASGSSIMSYVGICQPGRNLQQFVDAGLPAFHISSLTVINNNITTGPPQQTGCGTTSGTNNIPTVNAGAAYTIPRLTPFTLTATGNDADPGDVGNLLYSWEEYDLAPTSPNPPPDPQINITGASGSGANPANVFDIDSDNILRPILRAYSPVASNSRTFPSLPFILNTANNDPAGSNQPPLQYTGTHPSGASGAVCNPNEPNCVVGERLPTVNRTMNFRVSLRDRRGGVADAGTTVTVAAAAGPFLITSQNTAANWQGGSQQTITWDVAGTTGNGINAANVNILLSTDGGQTFPTTILANTPNDGTQTVTIPNSATTTGRIKIQASGNIFFDINDANITIAATNTPVRSPFDFDGDGKTDVSVYRSSNGVWYQQRSTEGFTTVQFGLGDDLIAPADFDGDGKTDVSVFRPSNGSWYRLNSADNTFFGVQFGQTGDIPLPADFDGDNKADINVFRPSTGGWYRLNSTDGQPVSNLFGQMGDIPVRADFNGDGRADLAVFRPSAGQWYAARTTGVPAQNFDVYYFGIAGDIPVPADYDGDGKSDVAVFRPSNGFWYRQNSSDNQFVAFRFGQNGDIPVVGDYDGDGKADIAVFRGTNGQWFSSNSQSGFSAVQFGLDSDKPVPSAYVNQ